MHRLNTRTTRRKPASSRMRSSPGYHRQADDEYISDEEGPSTNNDTTQSFSDSSSDFDSSDSEMDLSRDLKPIGLYIKNKPQMVHHMFRAIKGRQLRKIIPPILKRIPLEELQSLCTDEAEIMSKIRIRHILAGREMDSSSGTEESSSEDDLGEDNEAAHNVYHIREILVKGEESMQPDSTTAGEDIMKSDFQPDPTVSSSDQREEDKEEEKEESEGLQSDGDDIELIEDFEDDKMEEESSPEQVENQSPHYGRNSDEELDFDEDLGFDYEENEDKIDNLPSTIAEMLSEENSRDVFEEKIDDDDQKKKVKGNTAKIAIVPPMIIETPSEQIDKNETFEQNVDLAARMVPNENVCIVPPLIAEICPETEEKDEHYNEEVEEPLVVMEEDEERIENKGPSPIEQMEVMPENNEELLFGNEVTKPQESTAEDNIEIDSIDTPNDNEQSHSYMGSEYGRIEMATSPTNQDLPIRVEFDDKLETIEELLVDNPEIGRKTQQIDKEKVVISDNESFASDTEEGPTFSSSNVRESVIDMPLLVDDGIENETNTKVIEGAEPTTEWPPPPPAPGRVPWAEQETTNSPDSSSSESSDSDSSSTSSDEEKIEEGFEKEMTPEDMEAILYGDAGSDGEVDESSKESTSLPDQPMPAAMELLTLPPPPPPPDMSGEIAAQGEQLIEHGCEPPPPGWIGCEEEEEKDRKLPEECEEGEIIEGQENVEPTHPSFVDLAIPVASVGEEQVISQEYDIGAIPLPDEENNHLLQQENSQMLIADNKEAIVEQADPTIVVEAPQVAPVIINPESPQSDRSESPPLEADFGEEAVAFFGCELFQNEQTKSSKAQPETNKDNVDSISPPIINRDQPSAAGGGSDEGEIEGYDSDQSDGLEEGEILPPGMEPVKIMKMPVKRPLTLPAVEEDTDSREGTPSEVQGKRKKKSVLSIKALYKQLKAQKEAERLRGPPKVYSAEQRQEEIEAQLAKEEEKKRLKEEANQKPAGPDKPIPGIEWDYEQLEPTSTSTQIEQKPIKKKKKSEMLLTPDFLAELEHKKQKHQLEMQRKMELLEKLKVKREKMVQRERETKELVIKERKYGPLKRQKTPEPTYDEPSDEELDEPSTSSRHSKHSPMSQRERQKAREDLRRKRKVVIERSSEKHKRRSNSSSKSDRSPPRKSPHLPAVIDQPKKEPQTLYCNEEPPDVKPAAPQLEKQEVPPEPEVDQGDPELELYELELRARAIKALMKRRDDEDED